MTVRMNPETGIWEDDAIAEDSIDQDDDLGETPRAGTDALDDLMQESLEEPSSGDLLEDLLSESLVQVREQREAKAAKDRLKRGGLSAQERLEDEARIRAWEAAHEWKAEANVSLFIRYICACGSHREVFSGLMQREQHRHLTNHAKRWVAVPSAKADLPNEVLIKEQHMPLCYSCAEVKGWDLTKATVWEERV